MMLKSPPTTVAPMHLLQRSTNSTKVPRYPLVELNHTPHPYATSPCNVYPSVASWYQHHHEEGVVHLWTMGLW
jgi:hypothetical protein